MDLRRQKAWHRVHHVWCSALVPSGCVALQRVKGEASRLYFCLRSTDVGILCWPVQRVGQACLTLMGAGARCEWRQIYTVDGVYIIPIEPISPLHAFITDATPASSIGILCKHGAPQPLLQHQVRRGFAHVPDSILRRLALYFDLPPVECGAKEDVELCLTMQLIESLCPEMTEIECLAVLHQRSLECERLADDKATMEELVAADIIEDCVGRDEKKLVQGYIQDAEKALKRRCDANKVATELVKTAFEKKRAEAVAAKGKRRRPRHFRPRWPARARRSKRSLIDGGHRSQASR